MPDTPTTEDGSSRDLRATPVRGREDAHASTPHRWFTCPLCGPSVMCGTCGNNACNGGTGFNADGSRCADCEDAYQMMMTECGLAEFLASDGSAEAVTAQVSPPIREEN